MKQGIFLETKDLEFLQKLGREDDFIDIHYHKLAPSGKHFVIFSVKEEHKNYTSPELLKEWRNLHIGTE